MVIVPASSIKTEANPHFHLINGTDSLNAHGVAGVLGVRTKCGQHGSRDFGVNELNTNTHPSLTRAGM